MVWQPVQSWWEAVAAEQAILNARPIPRKFTTARPSIEVHARIAWEEDGVEWIRTQATAWTSTAVLVTITDRRRLTRGVWLPPGDICRI